MPDAAARRKFEALVAAAFADGFLAEAEKVVLQQKADQLGFTTREMHEIIGLGQQRKLSITIPSTPPERESLLNDLIEVCAADGRIEAPEYSLLARFAESLKISLPDLRIRVNRRMQGLSDRSTRAQARRESRPPLPPSGPRRVEPPSSPALPESASSMQAPVPMTAPPPTPSHQEFPREP
ncbi:MAG TPA: hypothetical protein VMU54_20515, partial [Planctomycetota bacterium]|nr:hypothetical protein [Planctomycetota bacterium]